MAIERELKQGTKVIYTDQAMMIIESLKDFNFDKFETEYLTPIVIGDITISRYILETKTKELQAKKEIPVNKEVK
jgi:hypothetical protein